jgi:hypothetical protein
VATRLQIGQTRPIRQIGRANDQQVVFAPGSSDRFLCRNAESPGSRLVQFAPPARESAEQLLLWSEAITGMRLQDNGAIEMLDGPAHAAVVKELTAPADGAGKP